MLPAPVASPQPVTVEGPLTPSLGDRISLASLNFKRWVLGRQPALLWTPRRLLLRGYPEPEIALLKFLCRPDAITVDVGASFGMWSFYARRYSRSVIAFELSRVLRRLSLDGSDVKVSTTDSRLHPPPESR